jgi:hypothetical protein
MIKRFRIFFLGITNRGESREWIEAYMLAHKYR